MGGWKANVVGCLPPALAAASVVIILELLAPPSAWPPVVSLATAILLSLFNVALAPAGPGRRRTFGFFMMLTTSAGVLRFGAVLGLGLAWQRWLVAIILSLPFFLLFATNSPGRLRDRVNDWKERRGRR